MSDAAGPSGDKLRCVHAAIGGRILALHGHEDFNQGQISFRAIGRPENMFIKDGMLAFDAVKPDDMLEWPLDPSRPLTRRLPPETPLHQAIYGLRPDVRCIVHTHHEDCIVFGALGLEMKAISHEGAFFAGRVGSFDGTSHTILDHELGSSVARTLAEGEVVLLKNHGFIAVGRSVRDAVLRALMFQRACHIQLRCEQFSRPYSVSRDEEVPLKRSYIYSDVAMASYWASLVGRASRAFEDIREWR